MLMININPGRVEWLISPINKDNLQSTWKIEKILAVYNFCSEAMQKMGQSNQMNIEEDDKSCIKILA